MKIIIPIQSYSDIITNSSSELFCVITSDEKLKEIYEVLENIIGYNQESEVTLVINLVNKQEEKNKILNRDWGVDYRYYDLTSYEEQTEDLPDHFIEIDFPYRLESVKPFYKAGFEAIFNEKFGERNYKIKYYD